MSIGERPDTPGDHDPRVANAFETAITDGTLSDTITRLSGLLARRISGDGAADRILALICQTFDEALTHRHDALFDPTEGLFHFLVRVIRIIEKRPQAHRGKILRLRRS